jgi:hypothetical protein
MLEQEVLPPLTACSGNGNWSFLSQEIERLEALVGAFVRGVVRRSRRSRSWRRRCDLAGGRAGDAIVNTVNPRRTRRSADVTLTYRDQHRAAGVPSGNEPTPC